MPIGATTAAVIGAGAGLAGGIMQSNAATDAADTQAAAANRAADQQLSMYNQTRSDLLPFAQGGQGAFTNLTSLLGLNGQANSQGMQSALQNYPGYQFALQQGNQALDRSAASKGLLMSGGQLKDLTNYNQGMASQLFGNYFNQNVQLANLGENAAATTGNSGANAANGYSNAIQNAGTAQASGIAGSNNALFGGGGALQNAFQAYTALNPSSSSSSGGAGPGWGGYSGDFSEFM